MTIWLEDGLKNQDQSVETASGKLVTPSESHSDDVWKFVTPSGSAVIKEALETLAWRRQLGLEFVGGRLVPDFGNILGFPNPSISSLIA
ncbi:hypothetical protein Tco_0607854 [Tanacetum coccineum]